MDDQDFLNSLSQDELSLSDKFFDLALGRVLKRVYLSLSDEDKKGMERIFAAGSEEDEENFVKNHAADIKKFFKEEADNIKKELKTNFKE